MWKNVELGANELALVLHLSSRHHLPAALFCSKKIFFFIRDFKQLVRQPLILQLPLVVLKPYPANYKWNCSIHIETFIIANRRFRSCHNWKEFRFYCRSFPHPRQINCLEVEVFTLKFGSRKVWSSSNYQCYKFS